MFLESWVISLWMWPIESTQQFGVKRLILWRVVVFETFIGPSKTVIEYWLPNQHTQPNTSKYIFSFCQIIN